MGVILREWARKLSSTAGKCLLSGDRRKVNAYFRLLPVIWELQFPAIAGSILHFPAEFAGKLSLGKALAVVKYRHSNEQK